MQMTKEFDVIVCGGGTSGGAAAISAALCVKRGVTPRELEKDVSELQRISIDQEAILYGTQ